ncbi:MAG: hypothetical protein QG657_5744 [Acidobacteriota bacterium]|nr:hypothetical protein [Acidobacteriota bacterium]
MVWIFVLSGSMMMMCNPAESNIWIVERDMPQTRNLVPILNRTTLIAAGPGPAATCTINQPVREIHIKEGPFWPRYGSKARMGLPVLAPDDFPCREPRVLETPLVSKKDTEIVLQWKDIKLTRGEGAAVHSDTWLGPPDMYHISQGLSFGDILVITDYQAQLDSGNSVTLTCRITLQNKHSEPVQGIDFSFFFPRALLDNETGQEIPLLEDFSYITQGFSDPQPLDLLICDGLGRGAWGPRCTILKESLEPGKSVDCSIQVKGKITGKEVVIVPLVSLVARISARYWPSSRIEISPPGKVHYSDYTHFNLVVGDSRLFRLAPGKATVEASAPLVRQFLDLK